MINERWLAAAITSDALVADLLLRLKQSSSPSDSSPPLNLNPPRWGDRKSRSKSTATGKGLQQTSPNTPLSSTTDDSVRCLDLYSGNRSVKIDMHENRKKECRSGSEIEMMKRRRCMLPDLNETPAPAYE